MYDDFKEKVSVLIHSVADYKFSRYLSWDYCYQAFATSKDIDQLSLHLAFYLASWGMYRGSSGLLQTNYKVHNRAVEIIMSNSYQKLRCTSENEIGKEDIKLLIELKENLSKHYNGINYDKGDNVKRSISATDTLISKIMLGTLACVPAFDDYLIEGMKAKGLQNRVFDTLTLTNMIDLTNYPFPLKNELQQEIKEITGDYYPMMKLIDMYFWQIGYEIRANQKTDSLRKK